MQYLVIQDDEEICDSIVGLITKNDSTPSIYIARSVISATSLLSAHDYDLVLFDIYLPVRDNDGHEDNYGADLLSAFEDSINAGTEAVLVTKDSFSDSTSIRLYNFWNVTVISYTENATEWKEALSRIIKKVIATPRYDFLILSALHKEALAYERTSANLGNFRTYPGGNFREISIGNHLGLSFEAAHPGPVNVSIMASKAIEQFRPKIVMMGGICAGIRGKVSPLDLIVANPCWNYQSGKMKAGVFYPEPYQFPISPELQAELTSYVSNKKDELLHELISQLNIRPDLKPKLYVGAAASGAGVVSDRKIIEDIKLQHRKVIAIDMEMAAFYEAAWFAKRKPAYLAAKAVVDLGDEEKNDDYHDEACVISARFIVGFIGHWLSIGESQEKILVK